MRALSCRNFWLNDKRVQYLASLVVSGNNVGQRVASMMMSMVNGDGGAPAVNDDERDGDVYK